MLMISFSTYNYLIQLLVILKIFIKSKFWFIYDYIFYIKIYLSFKVPQWACLLCALGLFIYQSLDAIDGKQARRTGTSTPLGELFDHGCDSLSTSMWNHFSLYKSIIKIISLYKIT